MTPVYPVKVPGNDPGETIRVRGKIDRRADGRNGGRV